MLIDGTWNVPTMSDTWGADLGIAVLPKYQEYKTATFSDPPVIWNDSPNKDLAFEFVQFLTDPALQIESYRSGNGVPTQLDYLSGDKLQEWLADMNLPEHYDTVVVDNLNYSGVMPGKVTALMPSLEWPVVMNQLLPAFRGEIEMQAAMDAAHDAATSVLAGE